MAKVICKDLKNKNCSLKNKRQEPYADGSLYCKECGGELIISNASILFLFLLVSLLVIGGGIYSYQKFGTVDKDETLKIKKNANLDKFREVGSKEEISNEKTTMEVEDEDKQENFGIQSKDTSSEEIEVLEKPKILSDITKVFHSNSFSLKLKGEVGSRVYINNEDMGSIGNIGTIDIPLDITKTKDFDIFLKDHSMNKKRSDSINFSIRKKNLDKKVKDNDMSFALVSDTRQEVSYLLDQILKYSDNESSIYSKEFIELENPVYMKTTPVTIKEFKKFVDESKYTPEGIKTGQLWNYTVQTPLEREYYSENYPVANISLNDIRQYILWLNKKTGYVHRLPTLEEWVMALNQYPQNNLSNRRQEVDLNFKGISQLYGNLYEFSSTHDSCKNNQVLLLGSLYSVSTNNNGKKRCDKIVQKTITFRLIREIE